MEVYSTPSLVMHEDRDNGYQDTLELCQNTVYPCTVLGSCGYDVSCFSTVPLIRLPTIPT